MNVPVAVVTGGGGGIGAATARRLAQEGYSLAVLDLAKEAAIEVADEIRSSASSRGSGTPTARAYEVAVTNLDHMRDTFESIARELGSIQVLVNNAGVCWESPLLELSVDEFRRVLDVNVIGVFVGTQVAASHMIATGTRGRVINLASINSRSISTANLSHYAASKGAVQMFTRASALELAPYGIRVNAVAPGVVNTPLVAKSLEDPERLEHFSRRIPRGELTQTDDVAETIAMLASPSLHAVTGITLPVDGGEHIGGARVD